MTPALRVLVCVILALGGVWVWRGGAGWFGRTGQGSIPADGFEHHTHGERERLSSRRAVGKGGPESAAERQAALREIIRKGETGMLPIGDLQDLFRYWFASDPEGALAAILTIREESLRAKALLQSLEVYSTDASRLVALCDRMLSLPDVRREFAWNCIRYLAANNSETAWDLLDLPSFAPYRQDSIKVMFETLGCPSSGWTAASVVNATRRLHSQDEIDMALRQAVSRVPGMGVSDYLEITKVSCDENVCWQAFLNLTRRSLAANGIDEYLRSIKTVPLSAMAQTTALRECLVARGGESLDHRLAKLRNSALWSVGKDDAMVAGEIARSISPNDGMKFAASVGADAPQAPAVFRVVAAQAVQRDANTCANWISSLPPGPARNAAIEPLLRYLEQHNEQESIAQWKTMISK